MPDRDEERLPIKRGNPSNIFERLFFSEEKILRQKASQCAQYVDKSFGIKIKPPVTAVNREPPDNRTILQHDIKMRPSYNFRTGKITCPIEKLTNLDPERPLEPVIFEELGHAYLAQTRPDIRKEIVTIVNDSAGLTTDSAERFVRIQLWNEGVANIFHRIIGKAWGEQYSVPKAVSTLRLSEIYEYDDNLRLKRAFCFNDQDRKEIDEIALLRTDAEIESLEDKAVDEDMKLLPQIISTLSNSAGFESGRNINELYQAINKLDQISYRSGYVFVKRIVKYLQDVHQYGLAKAIDWVITNGPPEEIDDFRDPLSWAKAKLQEH